MLTPFRFLALLGIIAPVPDGLFSFDWQRGFSFSVFG
jgi:hypothetical protein